MTRCPFAAVLVSSILLAAGVARGADLAVSDDAEAAAALAHAKPGDTITLAAGDYRGGWALPAGTAERPVTLRAAAPGQVFIKCADITQTPVGVQLADHTRAQGLALSGFVCGVLAKHRTDVEVINCVFFLDRAGVDFIACRQGGVVGCKFYSDPAPDAVRGVQLVASNGGQGLVWDRNRIQTATDAEVGGMMEGDDPFIHCTVSGNVFAGPAHESLVVTSPAGDSVAVEHNLALGALSGGVQKFNTCAAAKPEGQKDTQIIGLDDKWKFADPTYLDYRPQSDSPAQSAAPGNKDRGAFPVNDDIYYVERALGDNSNDGKTQGAPWQFFDAVADRLQAGQTLYIVAGPYSGPLTLTGLHAKPEQPTVIRVFNKVKFNIDAVVITDCQNLRIENLSTLRLTMDNSSNVTLTRCVVGKGAGATLTGCANVSIEHSAFWANAVGLTLKNCKTVSVTSTALLANKGGAIVGADQTPGFYQRFNLGLGPGEPPHADTEELILPPTAATAGRYGQSIGP